MKIDHRVVVGALLGAGLVIAVGPLASLAQPNNEETYKQLDLFATVLERVRADYVEEVTDKELIESAINGMLSALDPHSGYLSPDSYKDMQEQTRGEFGGLGIEVSMENGLVKVVSPIDDTPAFRAGIQAGDLITHLDGEPVLGLTLNDAVKKMRGPVDSKLTLSIRREGTEPFDVVITRGVINIRSVRHRMEGDVGYIRVTSFNEKTMPGIEKAIDDMKEEKGDQLKGIVLDLRNNPGGLLDQAVAVSDAFLDRGEIVSTRGRDKDDAQRFNARKGDLAEGLPIVVLINSGSASASEIVAGALQDHRRAILLGTKSFGKGSVQTIVPLANKGSMRLTTARYYTPSGRSIQAKGIDPDIIVEQARIEKLDGSGGLRREADLRGALENPEGVEGEQPAASDSDPELEGSPDGETTPVDYQLSRALDLINGLALYSQRQEGVPSTQ